MCIIPLICRVLHKTPTKSPSFPLKTPQNHPKITFFSKNTEILTFFSCILKIKYLNLQNNNKQKTKKITLKKYRNMNDADGQKT